MAQPGQTFGSSAEAFIYPALLLLVMWMAHWADYLFPELEFYRFGVKPQTIEGIKGIVLMPLIHSKRDFAHILNNSMPVFFLTAAVIYYYRAIALRVFLLIWVLTGAGLWAFASNSHSFHIGMSGIIYALAGFLFTSGVLRKYRPLQSISLFVVFVYGSMIWGIFPMESHVSWQGHLSGLVAGVFLALYYRNKGPQAPKYQYEIEMEHGIDPPDLEGEWNARQKELEERLRQQEEERRIVYHYKSTKPENENEEPQ